MNELTPHQQKALTTEGHLALTANAGSGKTFVLARKYLSILLKKNIEVPNVAAITFTEKAASELYYKIATLIDENIKTSTDRTDKKKLEKIRRQLVSANISTIHSFCIDILKQFPVEAKLDARFVPIDENLSNELIEISVDEIIRSSFDDDLVKENLKYLIRIFTSSSKLGTEIVRLIKNRKNVFAVQEKIYSNSSEYIQKYFSTKFNEYFSEIWEKYKDNFLKSLVKINSIVLDNDIENQSAIEMKNLLDKLDKEKEIPAIIKLLNQIKPLAFTEKIAIRKRGYVKGNLSESISSEIFISENLMSDLIKFDLPDDYQKIERELAKFGLIILEFFNQALKNYEGKKKAEGFIDFEDILLHTKILLQNSDVQKSLIDKYKFIMVDEFQDTNEIQYQIFLPILDYLKNGELFVVGDEKQSIYKFRDAEIEIFNQTRESIKAESGGKNLLSLPDSFRMAPAICTFTNFIFKNLFANPDELYGEVPNTDLVCARTNDVPGKVELLISKIDKTNKIIEEPEIVSNKILQIVKDGKYSWKDICILVRKRKNFDELEKSFLQNNIPYTIVGGRGFYQRQTISDVYNYLSFLADENNSPALVGVLRSPFFSVSDSKLYEISLQKGNSFWRKLKSFASEKEELQSCLAALEENIRLSNSIELPQLLKKLLTDQNYLAVVDSRIDGTQELANLDKLISIARNFNAKGFRNLYDFINYLKESITGLEDESQAALSQEKEAVQLMTIHQSKGLEFPIVFIYKASEPSLSSSLKSGQIQVDKKFGLLAKVPVDNNYLDDYSIAPIISVHNFLEAKKNLAELKRLLYVAVTRAKDELFISATIEEGKTFSKDSFILLLSSGLKSQFDSKEIVIKDKLNYLIKKGQEYETKNEKSEIVIPVIAELSSVQIPAKDKKLSSKEFEIELKKVISKETGEIISASKVSIFSQCPLKYLLTYEYGFAKLNADELSYKKLLRSADKSYLTEINNDEDEIYDLADEQGKAANFNPADYGRLVHSILEKEIPLENLDSYFSSDKNFDGSSIEFNKAGLRNIKNTLSDFFQSKTYHEIKKYKDYKNEFEIYVKDEDYFLHGIIDKIVFNNNKIIIFDYKTDDIKVTDVEKRGDYYLMQLKFYLYIASKLFKGFDNFEGNLVFIKHPENPVTVSFDNTKIQMLQTEIKSIINSLRHKEIEKKYTHCPMCVYSGFTKNCIIN